MQGNTWSYTAKKHSRGKKKKIKTLIYDSLGIWKSSFFFFFFFLPFKLEKERNQNSINSFSNECDSEHGSYRLCQSPDRRLGGGLNFYLLFDPFFLLHSTSTIQTYIAASDVSFLYLTELIFLPFLSTGCPFSISLGVLFFFFPQSLTPPPPPFS